MPGISMGAMGQDQCWTSTVFCRYHNDTSRVWVLGGIFVIDTIRVYIPYKNFHAKVNHPNLNMVRIRITQVIT